MGKLDLDCLRDSLHFSGFNKDQIEEIISDVLGCHEGDELEGLL